MGVVETETSFHVVSVNALDANGQPEEMETFEKPQPSPALAAAMKTPAAKVFLDFARFPWAQVEESELRLSRELERPAVLWLLGPVARFYPGVELDKNLQTRSEAFYFAAPRN